MNAIAGRVALVTGGSSGIGAACARELASRGAAVLATGRRFTRGTRGTVGPLIAGQVASAHLDVTDEAEVKSVFAALPEISILVFSAGDGAFGPLIDADVAALRAMLDVHVIGAMVCAREALRAMQRRRAGHIVVIGSHAAHHAFTDCGGYTAAKAGQLGLTRVLAAEARPHDVRVTAVLPGATDTPIWDDRPGFDRSKMLRPEAVASFVASILERPEIAVDEVTLTPPAGVL